MSGWPGEPLSSMEGETGRDWLIRPRGYPLGRMGGVPSPDPFRPSADELLEHNGRHVAEFADHGLALSPRRGLAVVACMDSRMDIFQMLGLAHGDAHIIRNAGGIVTDDVIRSLVVSQRLLNTREIILIHHTDCGMLTFTDEDFKAQIKEDVGEAPEWASEAFPDLEESVRESVRRIQSSPFNPKTDAVRGFVYELETGNLREVS